MEPSIKEKVTMYVEKVPMDDIEGEQGIIGKHVFGSLYHIDQKVTLDEKFIESVVREAVKVAKMHLVEVKAWRIDPAHEKAGGGVSVLALIEESHVAVHIWHKYRYATIDVYTCGEPSDPRAAFDYIAKNLNAKKQKVFYADRGM